MCKCVDFMSGSSAIIYFSIIPAVADITICFDHLNEFLYGIIAYN